MPRPTTALIIDDEPHVRTYLRLMLSELGVATQWEAGDGEEGLALALEHRPGVVLLDINLPVLDGLDVLARLRDSAPEIPVIMASSRTGLQTIHDADRLGAVAYILKHAPREDAMRSLRDVLESLADDSAVDEHEDLKRS